MCYVLMTGMCVCTIDYFGIRSCECVMCKSNRFAAGMSGAWVPAAVVTSQYLVRHVVWQQGLKLHRPDAAAPAPCCPCAALRTLTACCECGCICMLHKGLLAFHCKLQTGGMCSALVQGHCQYGSSPFSGLVTVPFCPPLMNSAWWLMDALAGIGRAERPHGPRQLVCLRVSAGARNRQQARGAAQWAVCCIPDKGMLLCSGSVFADRMHTWGLKWHANKCVCGCAAMMVVPYVRNVSVCW